MDVDVMGIECPYAEDLDLLTHLVKCHAGQTLVTNLCSGIDAVRVRRHLAKLKAAYRDSSASLSPERSNDKFSEVMSYTHTQVDSMYPQWICWGINPGLVEIVVGD
jgi:hypothetical protein